MFFAHAFQFRPVLERFDDFDGPRRLFNYVIFFLVAFLYDMKLFFLLI